MFCWLVLCGFIRFIWFSLFDILILFGGWRYFGFVQLCFSLVVSGVNVYFYLWMLSCCFGGFRVGLLFCGICLALLLVFDCYGLCCFGVFWCYLVLVTFAVLIALLFVLIFNDLFVLWVDVCSGVCLFRNFVRLCLVVGGWYVVYLACLDAFDY